MNFPQIEENLKSLIANLDREEFIYEFLKAYGLPKASITRLQQGTYNLAKDENEVLWKKRVHFRIEEKEDLHEKITELSKDIVHEQRFVIVTDFETLLARDTETKEYLDILLKDLPKHYAFFLPWAGMEKTAHQNENPADIKAAEKMAKLFDEIKKDNPDDSPEFLHDLNVFLSRLLFCLFAEDTEIFPEGIFTNGISSHTNADGSDLYEYLNEVFEILNTPKKERINLPAHFEAFPYVNGGLFKDQIQSPKFTRRSRQRIIESGELDWSEINPDIFGSMMQAVITPEHRGGLGMHYTSVPNIMKVIKPLFLDELYEELEKAEGNAIKLKDLLHRLHNLKIFDPACGSGNFLIIAYKELRRLEMMIFKVSGEMALSGITLDQFYGIELDDFAHELAQLSLWLAEHQMNVEFFKEFGRTNPTLPLKKAGKIVQGNACRIDWEVVCPKGKGVEIFILGNPPYLGQRNQLNDHKKDLKIAFEGQSNFKNLDYISIWFFLASGYISGNRSKFGFVSTNSICQGTQVDMLWPKISSLNLEIYFAYKDIKWTNNAKGNAGVTVSIIGVRNKTSDDKFLYLNNRRLRVTNINHFLIAGENINVSKRRTSISGLPEMIGGNQPREGGQLILNESEKNKLIEEDERISKFIRKLSGSNELLNDISRYCIWVKSNEFKKASEIPILLERFNKVKEHRTKGNTLERNFIKYSYRFVQNNEAESSQIVVPVVSSESRKYIPIGYLSDKQIVLNSANVIFDPDMYIFGIVSSQIHNLWVQTFAGKLENRIRYTTGICYNSFPFPKISNNRKDEIMQCVFRVLDEREKHSHKTIAELYDPNKMPVGLREAHKANDEVIERCYRSRPFESDEERLEYLFKLYKEMIVEEKNKETLFATQKKKRRR